ncbi:glycosyltransferase family 2 protein [Patescibacteria group bacterium]|nr:glycosyltransferase family 2 protein [Patescibacteria group bacterium]
MISIIITTYKESETLPKAIRAILNQNIKQEYELLVVGPDKKTQEVVREFSKYPQIKYLKDKGHGKPSALNLAFKKAKGKILVLTDGDVFIGENVLKRLIEPFQNDKIGAVSGNPVSLNSKNHILGYWSHFLTNAAHQWRLKGGDFPCSGYLYGFRDIIKEIPENVLAEDGIITQMIRDKDYQIAYAPEAKVYVKYPNNFKDWLKQKVRSTGGYSQKSQITNHKSQTNSKSKIQIIKTKKTRSFFQEIKDGLILFFTYPKTFKEFFYTILLYKARVLLWLIIFWKIKIRKKSFASIWQRVESTK